MNITCKLTGVTGRGVKAHIVPKAFYEIPPQEDGVSKLYSNTDGVYPKKTPKGVYDDSFVAKEGESCFDEIDSYAVDVLLNKIETFEENSKNGSTLAWTLESYDYKLLKLFSLSVLWRAHSSSNHVFSKVDLGPHEKFIKNMILAKDPKDEHTYSVQLARWYGGAIDNVIMDPFRERYEGINYYRVYCGKYVLYIKVDRRRSVGTFAKLQLKPDSPLYVISRKFDKSKEKKIMINVVSANER